MGEIGKLQQKLVATRRWMRTTRLLQGAAWMVCLVVALALLCYQLDSHLVLSPAARILWRTGIGLAAVLSLVVAAVLTFLKRLPDAAVAAEVERRYPVLHERLLTTVELTPALASSSADTNGFSRSMTASLAEDTNKATAGLDFRKAVNTRPLRNAGLTAIFMVLLLLAQRFAAPESFDNWLNRMRNPAADIPVWANTRVWVTPEKELLPVGEGVQVTVTTRGTRADSCTLYYRNADDKNAPWRSVALNSPVAAYDHPAAGAGVKTAGLADSGKPDALNFTYKFAALPASVEMYAKANDGRSNEHTVHVEPRPTLLNVKLTFHFPAYMHRDPQVVAVSTGNIAAPVGTEVDIEGTANKPLKSALFSQNAHSVGPWPVAGMKTTGHLSVWKDGNYSLNLTDRHDFENALPTPSYEIHALPDLPPTVQITRPASDIDLVPDGSLPLVGHATDDYGVVGVKLNYDKERGGAMNNSGEATMKTVGHGSLPLPQTATATQVNIAERWHIGGTHSLPGDTLKFELEAVDNDTLDGPHTGRSNAVRIHIVSLPEMQRKMKEDLDEEARALQQLRNSQIEAQHLLQNARAKMDKNALAHAQEAQRAVAEEAKQVASRIDDISAQLENNNLATKSELDRRAQAQQTVQNIAQQKAPSAADAVQHADAPKETASERNQSLTHANQEQNDIRHDIEKAQQLLARTPPPGQLAEEAARLAKEQQRLADQARSLSESARAEQAANGQLSPETKIGMETERQQQQQANEDTQRLAQQLKEAAQSAAERGQNKQAEALKAAAKALEQNRVTALQQQAQQNLNQSHPAQAAPQQDRAAAGLQKAADAAQQAAENAQQPTADQLERAAAQLHELARQQQEVANKTGQNPDSQQSKDLANQEKNIQNQANQAQQDLNGSRQAQQSLQQAQQNLSQAGKQLSQNQAQQAHSPAQQAAQNLERAAQQAENAAQQMRQQQAANELADRVERLAQIQAGLKNQTEHLDGVRQQRPLNNNENGELGQIASRQQNVEEEAKSLAERFPSPAFQNALQMAARQAHPATQNLNPEHGQPDTGKQTQAAQTKAAQTLNTIAQALRQQAQGGQQQQQQGQDQQQQQESAEQQQQAEALGELALAQGLQQQVRQNTGTLDQAHRNQPLTPDQQQQARDLTQDQQQARDVTDHANQTLGQLPGVAQNLQSAMQHMDQSHNNLNQQQTGQPTQTHQDQAIQQLAQAMQKAQQAMQQQQQQQQAQQQAQQGAPQPARQPGNNPDKNGFTRLEGVHGGASSAPNSRAGNFSQLSQRAQRTLREGQQEHVPAEFQDLVNRYYKSLAEKKQ